MAKTIEQLKTQSAEVKNASVIGENTATRVGSLFNDIVEHVEAYESGQAQKDTEQSTSIDAETTRATAVETTLSERINQEVTERKALDEAIGVQLSNEIERAKGMELGISTKLNDEIKRATEAENDLQGKITSEAEARDLAINVEAQARTQNDQLLSQAIAAEQERAEAAEATLDDAINTEKERAEAAEQANAEDIVELDSQINGYKIKKSSSDASHLAVSNGIIVKAEYSTDTLIFELPLVGDYLFDITADVYVVLEEPKVGVSVNPDKIRIINGVPFTNTERKWLMFQFNKSETDYSVTCELDANSIKSEIENLKDEISNISSTSDKITDPESGQSVKSQIDNLNGEIYGQDSKEVLVMESVAGQHKQSNTLISGRKYRVTANVVATTYMTFGFAQNDSQSWTDCLQVFRTNENGSLVFEAPNSETYPFVHMAGGIPPNSFQVYEIVESKDGLEPIIKGFDGRINTIEDSIIVSDKKVFDTIKATYDYRVGDTISVVGGESLYYAQVKKDDEVNVDFLITSNYFRYGFTTELPANGVSVTGSNAVNSSYTNVKITAPFDGYFVCSAATSTLKSLLVYGNKEGIGKEVYNLYPLRGKTVVMLGDSISQLPNTGNVRGDGICEYFAKITGANVVRGAISGSHVSSRDDVPATITDDQDARTILDMVNIARGLANGDISKQVEAANWCVANNKGDSFWKVTMDNLALVDMTKVDIVTIFGGTNDFNSGVTIGDVTSTNDKEYCGAINNIVEVLMTAYPHLSIFVFTPIVRHFVDSSTSSTDADFSDNYIKGGNKLTDIRDAAIRSAEHNHVPYCNLYDGMGWNKWNFWKFFPTNDGTHPRYGYQHIARKMAQFVCANLNRL